MALEQSRMRFNSNKESGSADAEFALTGDKQ
jgi:hypothetical protein